MRRCALIWLLASALAVVGTPDASARHKHVSPHSKKAVQVEQHKHRIDKSDVASTASLPPDLAAAKQAIELVRRHKANEATTLAASSGDPVVKKLVEWALLRRFESEAGFDRYVSFIRANPDWPSIPLLRRRAEMQAVAGAARRRDGASLRRRGTGQPGWPACARAHRRSERGTAPTPKARFARCGSRRSCRPNWKPQCSPRSPTC